MILWGLLDDRAGHATQVRGLVEALGLPHQFLPLSYNTLSTLPNLLLGKSVRHLSSASRTSLAGPWPDLVIACGRRTEPVARWIKQQNPATRIVYIMRPASLKEWDAVIIPAHDYVRGASRRPALPSLRGKALSFPRVPTDSVVISTHGPLHSITPALLDEARSMWASRFAELPAPRIGVLLGDVPLPIAQEMLARASVLSGKAGSLLITNSRRTSPSLLASLLPRITQPRSVFDWHAASGDNPYLGILASCERLIVSGDSLSMCVEAVASGVPTHIASWPALPAKHRALHRMLIAHGHALRLEDEGATILPTNDTLTVADALKEKFLPKK